MRRGKWKEERERRRKGEEKEGRQKKGPKVKASVSVCERVPGSTAKCDCVLLFLPPSHCSSRNVTCLLVGSPLRSARHHRMGGSFVCCHGTKVRHGADTQLQGDKQERGKVRVLSLHYHSHRPGTHAIRVLAIVISRLVFLYGQDIKPRFIQSICPFHYQRVGTPLLYAIEHD